MSNLRFKKLLSVPLIALPFFMAACATQSEPVAPKIAPGSSSFGDYLIGQFAVRHRAMDKAADFLMAVQSDKETPKDVATGLDRQLFTILAGEGRILEAAKVAEKLKQPNLMGDLVLIVRDVSQDDLKAAFQKTEKMSATGLGSFFRPLIYAWLIAANEGVDAALKSMDALKNQKGLEALYNLHAGLLNEYAGRADQAEEHYKIASKSPNGISLRLAEVYATLLTKQGRTADALKVYTDYALNHPESLYIQAMFDQLQSGALAKTPDITIRDGVAETLFGLSSSLRSASTRQMGLIMGQLSLFLQSNLPIARILVAEILESDQRFEAANKIYGSIDKNNPFSWSARLRLALNLDDMGRDQEAVDILKDMVKQHPDRLEAIITLGDVQRHSEAYDGAQKAYKQGIDLIKDNVQPHHWNLFYSRAITLERLKRWEEAEPLFLKALELQPDQPHVLNYLGYSWIELGRNLDQAQDMIEKAVAQRPRDGYIVDSLGWVHYLLGNFEEAVRHLERAVELQPSDPVINDHLGDAYWKVGRNREARFQWYRAKSLNPTEDVLAVIEQKIDRGLIEE